MIWKQTPNSSPARRSRSTSAGWGRGQHGAEAGGQPRQTARLAAAHGEVLGQLRHPVRLPVPQDVQSLPVVEAHHRLQVEAVNLQFRGRIEARRRDAPLRQEVEQVARVDGQVQAVAQVRGRRAAAQVGAIFDVVDDQAAGVSQLHQRCERDRGGFGTAAEAAGQRQQQGAPALAAPRQQVAARRFDLKWRAGRGRARQRRRQRPLDLLQQALRQHERHLTGARCRRQRP